MRFGFVSGSYTVQSQALADSEAINWFAESNEDGPPVIQGQAYGGNLSAQLKSYLATPGLAVFLTAAARSPIRAMFETNGRAFCVSDERFIEIFADGTQMDRGFVSSDGLAASICANSIQILIVSGGRAYCFTLTDTAWIPNNVYTVGQTILDPAGHIQKASATAWAASTAYTAGMQIVDPNSNVQKAEQAVWEPATVYAIKNQIVDASGHIQQAAAALWAASTVYAIGVEIVDTNGNIQKSAASMWVGNLTYAIDYQIVDSNGNVQKVTTAGTSGTVEPVWAAMGTTADGTIVWTYQAAGGGNAGTSGTTVPNWNEAVTLDNSPLYWIYQGSSGGNAGTSGATLPVFDDMGGSVPDAGTLVWTDMGLAVGAGTSGLTIPSFALTGVTLDNATGYLTWVYVAPSNGNAGTSGAMIPAFDDTGIPPGTTPDGPDTLLWVDQGLRLLEVTGQLAGAPAQCDCSDTYGVVIFQKSNKFQISEVLDFTSWPGELVNEVSVFAENIVSMKVNHRELWLFGSKRSQPYQDTGSNEIFDVIQGALIETGSAATFSVERIDNSLFWVGQDERGAVIAWRSSGYTPSRVSTHAVEVWLRAQTRIAELTSYAYQDGGHLFWVLYVPYADCSWVYDVTEGLWHKRAAYVNGIYEAHWSWNHAYAFGKHLVGDWKTGNVYEMNTAFLDDNGNSIRRLRRSPTVTSEMEWLRHAQLTVDFETGVGPQPPLLDGGGNPRPPQAMLRWSDDRGQTWSNQHVRSLGYAGEYRKRVFWMRLGRSRYRIYEVTVTDPVRCNLVDAYLDVGK